MIDNLLDSMNLSTRYMSREERYNLDVSILDVNINVEEFIREYVEENTLLSEVSIQDFENSIEAVENYALNAEMQGFEKFNIWFD